MYRYKSEHEELRVSIDRCQRVRKLVGEASNGREVRLFYMSPGGYTVSVFLLFSFFLSVSLFQVTRIDEFFLGHARTYGRRFSAWSHHGAKGRRGEKEGEEGKKR